MLSWICSAIDLASSSRTLSLVSFDFISVGDDRQHAVAEVPDVLGDEDEADAAGHHRHEAAEDRADDALADARGHVGELPAHHQHHRAGDAFAAFDQHLAGGDLGAALDRVDAVFLAGAVGDDAGDGRRRSGGRGRPACIAWRARPCRWWRARCACRSPCRGPSPAPSMAFFMGVGAVDPLGGGGGELLGLLARGQRRPQLEPARTPRAPRRSRGRPRGR